MPKSPIKWAELFAEDDLPDEAFPLSYKFIAQQQNKDDSVLDKIRTTVEG